MKVSDKYLSLVDEIIFMGGSILHMTMTEEQKLRTLIVHKAYQAWMSNKQIRPSDLCQRIAARIYGDLLLRAEINPHYRDLCEKLDIRPGVPRADSKIANDVQTLNHIIGRFNAPTMNIEKAKVIAGMVITGNH